MVAVSLGKVIGRDPVLMPEMLGNVERLVLRSREMDLVTVRVPRARVHAAT